MMKKILACALCVALVLSHIPVASARDESNFYDDSAVRQLTTVVYCLSEDRYRLMPDVRTVSVLSSETMLEVLANEVLQPCETDGLISAMTERVRLYLLSVAQTGRIATVDLGGDAEMMQPYEAFCLKAALANTLIESGQVDYVNVLFNGREVTTNDLPTGTLIRFDEDLQSAWIAHENEGVAALRSADYSFKRYVTLFFASNDSDFLLAEVRQLTFTRSNLATPVISAIISGPMDSSVLCRSYPSAAKVSGIPSIEKENSQTNFLDVDFSSEMANAFAGDRVGRRLTLGPMVLTLTTFLPETDAVRIRINHRPIESFSASDSSDRLLFREQFVGLLGRTVELYFPKEDGRQLCVVRAVAQKESTLRDLVEQLLIVPENALAVFPEGFTAEHLRGTAMVDDIAVVNLTQEGAALLSELSPEQERSMVFCIVNTLTGYGGVNRVQFLVEGYKINSLAGTISLRSPLVRNPGVIQTTLN